MKDDRNREDVCGKAVRPVLRGHARGAPPGVTIGPGCVVGAGSVVTRDIPADSLAAGNPCRVLRPITKADRMASHPERMAEK